MITHIFSNLDGMLLDEEGKVTPKTKVWHSISLVSARTPNDMEKIVNSTKTNLEACVSFGIENFLIKK